MLLPLSLCVFSKQGPPGQKGQRGFLGEEGDIVSASSFSLSTKHNNFWMWWHIECGRKFVYCISSNKSRVSNNGRGCSLHQQIKACSKWRPGYIVYIRNYNNNNINMLFSTFCCCLGYISEVLMLHFNHCRCLCVDIPAKLYFVVLKQNAVTLSGKMGPD